jgi:hypothetical protein
VRGWSERETFDSVGTTAQQFTVTGVRNLNAAAVQAVSSQFIDIRSDRVQGAVNLDYRDKLILDGAFTRDAARSSAPRRGGTTSTGSARSTA